MEESTRQNRAIWSHLPSSLLLDARNVVRFRNSPSSEGSTPRRSEELRSKFENVVHRPTSVGTVLCRPDGAQCANTPVALGNACARTTVPSGHASHVSRPPTVGASDTVPLGQSLHGRPAAPTSLYSPTPHWHSLRELAASKLHFADPVPSGGAQKGRWGQPDA